MGGATEKKGRRRAMKGPGLWTEHSPKKVGSGKDQHVIGWRLVWAWSDNMGAWQTVGRARLSLGGACSKAGDWVEACGHGQEKGRGPTALLTS